MGKKIKQFLCLNKNIGDLIGPYLTNKIMRDDIPITNANDENIPHGETILFSVGTILHGPLLQKYLENDNTIYVWGSGGGNLDQTTSVYIKEKIKQNKILINAVRGKSTQKNIRDKLGICVDILGDPAILLPHVYDPKIEKKDNVGIIFHWEHLRDLKEAGTYLDTIANFKEKYGNIKIIDIECETRRDLNSVETLIDEIKSCNTIVSSSLHGVILAHAYNIPSMPFYVKKSYYDPWKFADYYSAFDYILDIDSFSNFHSDELKSESEIRNMFQPYNSKTFSGGKNLSKLLMSSFPWK